MARTESRHRRGSRDGGEVIVVSQRSSGNDKQSTPKNSHMKAGTAQDKKNITISGRMWDSFESESASEDDEDRVIENKRSLDRESRKHPAKSNRDNRGQHPQRDRANSVEASDVAGAKRSGSLATKDQNRTTRSHSRSSTRSNSRSSKSKFRKGDIVNVYLSSEGKAKGTISGESSGGRYDVILENGNIEKRVDHRDISFAHRHQRSSRTSDRRSSTGSQKSVDSHQKSDDNFQESIDNALAHQASEPGSDTPRQEPPPPSMPPPSSKEATINQAGKRPVSPLSSKSPTVSIKGGIEPARPQNKAVVLSPVPATSSKGLLIPITVESEQEITKGERVSLSEGDPSPLTNKVRQAQGLLRTMFWKKGDLRSEYEDDGSHTNRRWSRSNSISRRLSTDNAHRSDVDSTSADLSDAEDTREGARMPKSPTVGDEISIADAKQPKGGSPKGSSTMGGYSRRLSRGLSRGRSKYRKGGEQRESSASPASRSPSLATKLGTTLRGVIIGKTTLGIHKPHTEGRSASCLPINGSDEDGSENTYSTDASDTRNPQRFRRGRERQSMKDALHGRAGGNNFEVGHECFSGEFGSDIYSPNSPPAPTAYGDPRNLPDAVNSYIGVREKIGQEMGAQGPVFLPQSSKFNSSPREGAIGWGKRRGSLDITKQASSTTQLSKQHQPFTESMFKAGVSETRLATKQGILLEGDLQKFSPESIRGVRWHKRYFVLYAGACELRYYRTHVEAAWGNIPLGERGSIPLRLVVKIEQPSDKKYHGCRFDLIVLHKGDGRHPGLHIRPGQESRVFTTKTFKFKAVDAQQRLLWVTVIEALMKKHGWGLDVDRRNTMRAPGHGSISASNGDPLWGTWGGAAEEMAFNEPAGRCMRQLRWETSIRGSEEASSSRKDDSSMRKQAEADSEPRRGSVLTFVEEDSISQQQGKLHEQRGIAPASRRGFQIPYSPQGRKGSLTTGSLSPPVPTSGGARRQSSLKSDFFI